jgi:hypothetical protein
MAESDLAAPRLGGLYVAPRGIASFDALGTFATVGLAVIVTGFPVVVHLAAGQTLAVATCFLLGLLVANFAAPAAPIVLIFSYLFQNLFVALVSPLVGNLDEFNAVRAYNFVLTATIWIVVAGSYWLGHANFDARLRSVINVTTIALVVVGLYFGVGLLKDPSAATVYLRNIAAPLFLFQIFTLVAYRYRVSVTAALILIATAALLFGYLELVAQEKLFRLTNGDIYLKWRMKQGVDAGIWLKELQETGRVFRGYLDAMTIDFLNTPLLGDLGLRFHRIVGPNFHSISFAYALAVFSILLAAIGHRWFALIAFPALLVIGSKGALLLVVIVTAALFVMRRFRGVGPLWFFATLLLIGAAAGIVMGIRAQDYHVMGFLGGLNGFLQNPLGHGLGAGGNLSLDMTVIDWGRSQTLGSTDIAVESAIGVLLYQMGVFGVGFLGVLGWIAVKLWGLYMGKGERVLAVAALGLLTITVNGIFQEEALFSPLALGLLLALCGLLLGRAYRVAAAAFVGGSQHRCGGSPRTDDHFAGELRTVDGA